MLSIATTTRIVADLNRLGGDDPEKSREAAEKLLLEAVPAEIRAAYERLVRRCQWWAAS